MVSDDDKESNVAKGENIATEFNEFKDILFNEKKPRHKLERIQSKKLKVGHVKSAKYHYRVLMVKDLL